MTLSLEWREESPIQWDLYVGDKRIISVKTWQTDVNLPDWYATYYLACFSQGHRFLGKDITVAKKDAIEFLVYQLTSIKAEANFVLHLLQGGDVQ